MKKNINKYIKKYKYTIKDDLTGITYETNSTRATKNIIEELKEQHTERTKHQDGDEVLKPIYSIYIRNEEKGRQVITFYYNEY